jgi:hypothetical protein
MLACNRPGPVVRIDGMADVDRFEDFYRGSRQRVLAYVYLITSALSEAQDSVQEAFVRAWQRWPSLGADGDPEAWVRKVQLNLIELPAHPNGAPAPHMYAFVRVGRAVILLRPSKKVEDSWLQGVARIAATRA